MKKRVAIIGGGASGVMLACLLKDEFDISIFEAQNRILKKVLASGNGMCNLTNARLSDINNLNGIYNHDLSMVLNRFDLNKCIDTFKDLGLIIRPDSADRYYPYSKRSNNVYDAFDYELKRKGVKIYTDCRIDKIEYKDSFILNNKYQADYLVFACGSIAQINFDYNAYDILKKMDYHIKDIKPSLVGFTTIENVKSLSGLRIKANVSLYENNKLKEDNFGEVQFKDDGISGIVVMEESRLYNDKSDSYVLLDFAYDYSLEELKELIKKYYDKFKDLNKTLNAFLPKMLAQYIIKMGKNLDDIAYIIKNCRFNIKGTYDFKNCQVCRGGLDLAEIDLNTFASLKNKNIYFMGELLDVDGTCGGFNLHFAWASAYIVSESLNKLI